jgi:hypothetical protein
MSYYQYGKTISGDYFRDICDYYVDETKETNFIELITNINKREHTTLFIKTDYVLFFLEKVYPHIESNITILTHNSDYQVPNIHDNINYKLNNKIIEDLLNEKLIWYGENSCIDEIYKLPLGLRNDRLKYDKFIYQEYIPLQNKENLLYMNFDPSTNKYCNYLKYKHNREECYKTLSKKYDFIQNRKYHDFLSDMNHSKFVVCPVGGGLDSHRVYETLYCQSIPIVFDTPLNSMYEKLPIVIVDNWEICLDEDFLLKKMKEIEFKMNNNDYNYEIIYTNYYDTLFNKI